jgi:hypothetical protein
VFTWVNDNSAGTAPPVAVDNIVLTSSTANGTEANPFPLTINTWLDGNLTSTTNAVWYSFSVISGTTYRIWVNDSYQGNDTKTAEVNISAQHSNGTSYSISNQSGSWDTSQSITPSASGTVYIKVYPYSATSKNIGTYGIAYSTSSTRP